MIPNFTIYSDKVSLTANFYIEYLGFNLLYKVEDDENPYVWLEFRGQFLLIWPWTNKLGVARTVVFEVPDILDWYIHLEQCVKINVPLFKRTNGVQSFSILDCEENVIHFIEESSHTVSSSEELKTMELTFNVNNI